uniref:NADH-ubiquinone oxidoreductase chain 1 n=1 Tax=Tetraodon nigroviridis TaxID=99883 RepID=H3BYA1_TETNG
MITTLITHILNPLAFIVPVLLAVAFLTLLERKVLGYIQLRKARTTLNLLPNPIHPHPHTSPHISHNTMSPPTPSIPTILFILALSSLAVYSILASNSKYALVGALRAVAQTISYEVSLGLILLSLIIFTGGFTLQTFNTAQETETNRAPFDLTEGERPFRPILPRRIRQHPIYKHPFRQPLPRSLPYPNTSRTDHNKPNNQSSRPLTRLPMGLPPQI